MKKGYLKPLIGLLLLFALISNGCKDSFFDQVPDDRLSEADLFQKKKDAEAVLYRVYAFTGIAEDFDVWSSSPWLGLSDEADMTWQRDGWETYKMNMGIWDASANNFFSKWADFYKGIRLATYFLGRIDECTELTANEITSYKAEARFLRAYYYFALLRQYGPVVLLRDEIIPLDATEADLQLSRTPFDESVSWVVSELDAVTNDLPLNITDINFYGKPTKGAALAVKAKLLLYAASPLFNGNPDFSSFTNKDGTQLMSTTQSSEKWKDAAAAAKAVIDLNNYTLYKKNDAQGNYDPYASYRDLFLDDWNSEVIWARYTNTYDKPTNFPRLCGPRQAGASNGIAATQQIVDAYFMANGKLKDEEGSGYVETGFSTTAGKYTSEQTYNMYTNREPRFYVSISYNGSYWINPNTSKGNFKIQYYNKGLDGKTGSYNYPQSGYCIRKFCDPNQNDLTEVYPKHHLTLFRLGEVYLDYIEALNEYEPGNPDILKYLNLIRERAGIPQYGAGVDALPVPLGQVEVREKIHAERRVELAFESTRYFDTRRWKIAEETDGGPFWGMNMDAGTSLTDPAFYQRTIFETRIFEKKHYLFPIPKLEIEKDPNLVQNPGW